MRAECGADPGFRVAMEEELNLLITGESRRETLDADARGYAQQRALLEEAARGNPKYQKALDEHVPTVERRRELAKRWIVMTSPGIPADVPLDWYLKHRLSGTSVTPDFGFLREPKWDHDDVAEYGLDSQGLLSFKILFVRWLSYQWSVLRVAEARSALIKAFQPLLKTLVRKYRNAGRREFGATYEASASEVLRANLERLVDEFDFFHRRYVMMGKKRYDADSIEYRRQGHITSDFELPIANFLERKLDSAVRAFVGIVKQRREYRVVGPFEVEGLPGRVFLRDDVMELLRLRDTRVRDLNKLQVFTSWQAPAFRKLIGIGPMEEILLRNGVGEELSVSSHKYWFYDEASVLEYMDLRSSGRAFGRRGRPRKIVKQASVESPQTNAQEQPRNDSELEIKPRSHGIRVSLVNDDEVE